MKNKLDLDPSPYLQQHKNNPVFWQTWTQDSLNLAKSKKKPILLSIGYASCHWCHVMAHESFEDQETADLMNANFINIKVDREERPDIDFIYQSSFQLFNNAGGGWPLTIFLDENTVPFMAGTYFPKVEQNGLPDFKTVLKKVFQAYSEQREKIILQKSLITKSLELKKNSVITQDLQPFLDSILDNLDHKNGGYKGQPKFPTFYVFDTLLYFYNKTKNPKFFKPVELILTQLCSRGIYDHVEGGIARYTVDDQWIVPHFEKMLYDNAQFVLLLAKFCSIKKDDYFNSKIEQTISFINSNFTIKESQLLGSAYDADSEGHEGKYYVYQYDEIKKINNIHDFFEIKPEGNWEGKIILIEKQLAPRELLIELLEIRKKRKKPFFDEKTQLDLNSLWISSLVKAAEILPKNNYLKSAEKLLLNLEKKFAKPKIFHSSSSNTVFLEDYAFLINALIDLADATLKVEYKIKAKEYTKEVINLFYIKEKNIFQKNPINTNDLFFEPIDISDHTIPNGNSVMLSNFVRLGFMDEGKKLSHSLNGYINIYKNYMSSSIKSINFYEETSKGKNCNDNGCSI